MKPRREDKNKWGIYCIQNTSDNKIYIGKSKDIFRRISEHLFLLRKQSKSKSLHENRHLYNAWHKYGESCFAYFVVEYTAENVNILAERELYWIEYLNATDRKYGYNLRMDSSSGMICSEETRKLRCILCKGSNNPNYGNYWSEEKKRKMSELKLQQYKEGIVKPNLNATYKGINQRNKNWENNPQLKEIMKNKVSTVRNKYTFYQYDKNHVLVHIWNSMREILLANPTYKRHNIYAVCSKEKPSMYGYVWEKVLNDDIVRQ